MSDNFTWKITSVDVEDIDPHENCVVRVAYMVTGTGNDRIFNYSSNQEIEYQEGDFTAFEMLTQEQIIGWLKESLGETIIQRIEDRITTALTSPVPSVAVDDNTQRSYLPPWLENGGQ